MCSCIVIGACIGIYLYILVVNVEMNFKSASNETHPPSLFLPPSSNVIG